VPVLEDYFESLVEKWRERIKLAMPKQGTGSELKVNRFSKSEERKVQIMQATMTQISDPAKARAYFEDKMAFTTGPLELDRMIRSGENNLTVVTFGKRRTFAKGHVPGAINLPKEKWGAFKDCRRIRTTLFIVTLQTCHLAANACRLFASKGFPVMEMDGGFKAWKDYDLDIEREPVNRLK